jgi:hypothetical protein
MKYKNSFKMKNIFRILAILVLIIAFAKVNYAEEYKFGSFKSTESIESTAAGCAAPSGFEFLQVNNVRARINTGGDMWWDLDGIGQYYIPGNTTQTSMFSSSLWIGGLDINNQLKLAALRYRQVGQDYWTGPLTIDGTAAIDIETCAEWDKFSIVTRAEVDLFIDWFNSENKADDFPDYVIPNSILDYPAHGDVSKGQSYYLAPFKDVDNDGEYDPNNGDYPYYDIDNDLCPLNFAGDPTYIPTPTMESEFYEEYFGGILVDQVLKGDETFWWVFNDKGNFHSETNGASIGLEIRGQAFGFATNDEVNNMSFYSYEIINRSTYVLTETYFSPWVDTDLGYAWDDYVGCDVNRGLGYCYNGLPIDGAGEPESYGSQPPAIGVDFFQGPYMDPDTCDNPAYFGDGLLGPTIDDCSIVSFHMADRSLTYGENGEFSGTFTVRSEAINGVNFGNGIVDDERYGMRRFVYHNNAGGVSGDPEIAPEYYNYLRGFWRDNSRMQYGGNGHINSGALGPDCDFMFPGDTDPCNWGTKGIPPNGGFNQGGQYWTEEYVGNNPNDRRFMQSAGGFTLKPGAVNYITVGIPWARAISGGPWASVELLRVVDDKSQALFDNCFKIIDGPSAPDLTLKELDQKLIFYISNSKTSNNYKESYSEIDPQIKAIRPDSIPINEWNDTYDFEGYLIYQLADASVTIAESRFDPDKVRLIAQFDIRNGVGRLVNYEFDQFIGGNVPTVQNTDGDNGIVHSFEIFEDAFATGNRALVNHKQYYFSALAYSYNNYRDYKQDDPDYSGGQKKPFLSGRKNIKLYTGIPHKAVNGQIANSKYGDGAQITRIEGQGNGGLHLEFTQETIDEILSKSPVSDDNQYGNPNYPIAYNPVYEAGKGPVSIKVIDPLNVKGGNYTIKLRPFDTVPARLINGDTLFWESAYWDLFDSNGQLINSSTTSIGVQNEQLFLDLGISIFFRQIFPPGPTTIDKVYKGIGLMENNGLITSSIQYADSSKQWLSGVQDNDVPGSPVNWIRSGNYVDQQNPDFNDWDIHEGHLQPWDENEAYEKIVEGTWAPYGMCAFNEVDPSGPVFNKLSIIDSTYLSNIASVNIVITPDKSKWSRCPVIEMSADPVLAEGNVERFALRASPSVDKDGNPYEGADSISSDNPNDANYIRATGMGWFPGYAINLETGERLNVMFGEDSWLVADNGRDMLFNPTSRGFDIPSFETIFGGKHYVYIMDHEKVFVDVLGGYTFNFPAYDACKTIVETLVNDTIITLVKGTGVFRSAMYVGMPLAESGQDWLSNDVTIKIRVGKPYARYNSAPLDSIPDGTKNDLFPMYSFSTDAIATTLYDEEKATSSDLDLIGVVPNPYYAYSDYERNALDNRVRVINLPEKCTVMIYNVNGTLIRTYTKDDPITSIDWDLKNTAGIPIAGGVYLFHIKDEKSGEERIVKWFGSLRVEDFNRF